MWFGQQCYWFVYTGHRHPHTTKLVQKQLKTERHLQIKVQRVPLIQDVKWGKLLATAPKIVCLNVWILQAVIWAKFHSHLDMREASVSHLTAVTVRATVNCHGYRGIRQVILFHPAWKADLVGGIIRVVLHVMLHTVFLHFLFLFHCLETKSLTYLFCSTIMLHILVAFVCNMLSLYVSFVFFFFGCHFMRVYHHHHWHWNSFTLHMFHIWPI